MKSPPTGAGRLPCEFGPPGRCLMSSIDAGRGASLSKPGASRWFDRRWLALLMVAILAGPAAAQEPRPKPAEVEATIKRGLGFLVKDALAWKEKHNCASCHHASLIIWSMQEAKQRGHEVDETVLADLTKWVA